MQKRSITAVSFAEASDCVRESRLNLLMWTINYVSKISSNNLISTGKTLIGLRSLNSFGEENLDTGVTKANFPRARKPTFAYANINDVCYERK